MSASEANPKVPLVPADEGASLLAELSGFIRRFVSLTPAQADVCALWVAHTHAFAAAEATAYLAIRSAEKQSGKTRLLEVLELLVNKPWFTCSATASVLKRKIDEESPTLLLDESDAAFKGEKEYAEALRGLLNAGHRRGGVASMSVVQGANITYKDFKVFCPKALAGLGTLPDTVADRTIPVRLKRKAAPEKVQRFRRREVEEQARPLRERLAVWTAAHLKGLRDSRPQLPEELSDRQQDGAEPLLAIANLAGGEWPQRGRAALVELLGSPAAEDDSVGVRLLADIRDAFESHADRIRSEDLVRELTAIEGSPWAEFSKGKPLTVYRLARLLHRYEIGPRNIREGGDKVHKGYLREQFEDGWARYLPPCAPNPAAEPLQPLQASIDAVAGAFSEPLQGRAVAEGKTEETAARAQVVARVADHCYIHGKETRWWERPGGELLCARCHPDPCAGVTVAPLTARDVGF